jgi:hypothetical protein
MVPVSGHQRTSAQGLVASCKPLQGCTSSSVTVQPAAIIGWLTEQPVVSLSVKRHSQNGLTDAFVSIINKERNPKTQFGTSLSASMRAAKRVFSL